MLVKAAGYILLLIGYIILSSIVLLPLRVEYERQLLDYRLLQRSISEIRSAVFRLRSQIDAIGSDPQFTEFILRKELGVKKPGVETIRIEPKPLPEGTFYDRGDVRPIDIELDGIYILGKEGRTSIGAFLDPVKRKWLMGIGMGLFISGLVVIFSNNGDKRVGKIV